MADPHLLQLLTNTTTTSTQRALARAYLKGPVESPVNAYLVNTRAKLLLTDTGTSTFFGPTLGRLLANLKASGCQPEQIDETYRTHLYVRHVRGLVADGRPAFPNAIVRAGRRAFDFWPSRKNLDTARGGCYVAVRHIAFPGIGRRRADGKEYNWVPGNFTVLQ